jgi:tetratricopeptide (TPR) repeat protein
LGSEPRAGTAVSCVGLGLFYIEYVRGGPSALKQSLEIAQDNPAAAISYGRLLLRQPDGRENGLRWLRRATSIVPRSAPAWRILAEALFRADLTEEAAAAIERAVKLAPADPAIAALQRRITGGGGASIVSAAIPTAIPGLDDLVVSISTAAPIAPPPAKTPVPAKPEGEGTGPVFDLSVLKIRE